MATESGSDGTRAARVERRRRLRKGSTDAESFLWRLLRDRQLEGAKFRRQHQVGPYVLDFYCPEYRLAVESDGSQHLTAEGLARDEKRRRYLEDKGIRVVRFSNREVLLETESVREAIWQALVGEPSP